MAEDLQNLLDRIQKDGVEQAEAQAETILAQARDKAAAILREAEKQAAETRVGAEKDAEVFVERSTKTLEQAARDFLISVGRSVESGLRGCRQGDRGRCAHAGHHGADADPHGGYVRGARRWRGSHRHPSECPGSQGSGGHPHAARPRVARGGAWNSTQKTASTVGSRCRSATTICIMTSPCRLLPIPSRNC